MNIASPKQKKRYRFYNMTCNALEQPPQAKVERLNILVIMSNGVEVGVHELNSIYRSCRKSDRKREGRLLFLIVSVSYNARYAKLREAKNAHFPDFWYFCLGWLIFVLVQLFCTVCTFYHGLLFSLSHTYLLFLC